MSIERNTKDTLWIDRIRMSHTDYHGKYSPTIDVFIFDHVPECTLKAKLKLYTFYMLQGMMKSKIVLRKGNMFLKFSSLVTWATGRLFTQKKYSWYNKLSAYGNNQNCTYGSCYNYTFKGMRLRFDSNILCSTIRLPFENIVVSGMKKFDHYYNNIWGLHDIAKNYRKDTQTSIKIHVYKSFIVSLYFSKLRWP